MESLRSALNVLSKSSPQAVEVEKDEENQNHFKEFLYIETLIEKDFTNRLKALQPAEIIFLCGSSGDGKSAILTRYSKKYAGSIRFHLDATHSHDPHKDAICELDKLFSEVTENREPLVVGINVGMMGNYAERGSDKHTAIKNSMNAHIQCLAPPAQHYYFDFERYPKFEFRNHSAYSNFAEAFMKRLTQPEDNPFIDLLKKAQSEGSDPKLCANFELLALPTVQKVIVDALMKARLINDQFMTSRALLDFIHHLLTSSGYLFDNLYAASDNELSHRITGFDPATIRTKKTDHFILEYQLDLIEEEFRKFYEEIQSDFGISNHEMGPDSYIRLFYILKDTEFSNNYHHRFGVDFSNSLLEQFAQIWKLHSDFKEDGPKEAKSALQNFYTDILLNGLHRYMNRRAPELLQKQYFISEYNSVKIVTELKIRPDLNAIASTRNNTFTTFFNAYLKVGSHLLPPLVVNINLYELLIKLKEGYRPNKHDKSTVLILDELVAQIIEVANRQQDKFLFIDGSNRYEVEQDDDDLLVMEG
jgi:DNA phosphorothioation-dependent restriction protein DptF